MEQHPQDPPEIVEDELAFRQDARDSLFLMADIRVVGENTVRSVRVRNLSASGLMADLPAGMTQGVRVEVGVRGIGSVPGQVAWNAAGRIGIAFDYQIDPLLARKPVGVGAHTPAFAKSLFPPRFPR